MTKITLALYGTNIPSDINIDTCASINKSDVFLDPYKDIPLQYICITNALNNMLNKYKYIVLPKGYYSQIFGFDPLQN
jgi:hypothetical protein